MGQINMFELTKELYVLPNKPKVFEAFAGIGYRKSMCSHGPSLVRT